MIAPPPLSGSVLKQSKENLARAQTSRFITDSAFFSMNSRRGST